MHENWCGSKFNCEISTLHLNQSLFIEKNIFLAPHLSYCYATIRGKVKGKFLIEASWNCVNWITSDFPRFWQALTWNFMIFQSLKGNHNFLKNPFNYSSNDFVLFWSQWNPLEYPIQSASVCIVSSVVRIF